MILGGPEETDMGETMDINQLDAELMREDADNEAIAYDRGAIMMEGIHIDGDMYDGEYYYNDGEEGDFNDD